MGMPKGWRSPSHRLGSGSRGGRGHCGVPRGAYARRAHERNDGSRVTPRYPTTPTTSTVLSVEAVRECWTYGCANPREDEGVRSCEAPIQRDGSEPDVVVELRRPSGAGGPEDATTLLKPRGVRRAGLRLLLRCRGRLLLLVSHDRPMFSSSPIISIPKNTSAAPWYQ